VTGFIADDVDNLVSFIPSVLELDRRKCRLHVEQYFSAQRMADDYLAVYYQLVKNKEFSSCNASLVHSLSPANKLMEGKPFLPADSNVFSYTQGKKKSSQHYLL
jgi:hypothetical protein